ncbi:hypothetical protein GOV03_01050 [Candidatus Woesearchaeota archaeon]|nr:hypothetical protein [Candidatus Woesearchaeota archaeon]
MKNKILLMWLLLVLLAVSLVSAEGCYLHPESALYCLDLEAEEAAGDCAIYGECVIGKVFFEGKSCLDLNMFPKCQEVFCKSTCDYRSLGICLGGEVPAGEEEVWCSAGCCSFAYAGGEFCEFTDSKWSCELEAKNKEVNLFGFELLGERECKGTCSGELILEPSVTEEIEEDTEMNWLWGILIIFSLAVILYLVYWKRKPKKKAVKSIEVKKKPRFFLRRRSIKKREARLKNMKEEMKHKIKLRAREELFELFGVQEGNDLSHVDLLGKVVFAHKLHKKRQQKETDIFKKVETLIDQAKLKEKEAMTEQEAKNIFEKLKRIVEKK